jgi:hypothetical protein
VPHFWLFLPEVGILIFWEVIGKTKSCSSHLAREAGLSGFLKSIASIGVAGVQIFTGLDVQLPLPCRVLRPVRDSLLQKWYAFCESPLFENSNAQVDYRVNVRRGMPQESRVWLASLSNYQRIFVNSRLSIRRRNFLMSGDLVQTDLQRNDRQTNKEVGSNPRRNNQQGSAAVQVVWVLAGLAVIIAAFLYMRTVTPSSVSFTTPYQAVLLTNGMAYFGKLQGYGTPRPVLTEVYYIVTQTNPDTKQNNNVLVKRGKELHEPDRMYINPNQILCVEPVGPNSKVAQLIAQQGH